jgi:hypothetical protein
VTELTLRRPALAALGLCVSGCQLTLDDRPEPQVAVPSLEAAGVADSTEPPAPYRPELDQRRGPGWSSDCAPGMSVEAGTQTPGGQALRFIAVGEPGLGSGPVFSARGQVVVNLFLPGPSVLVLSAREATHWSVHVGAGASLDAVFLSGLYRHALSAPPEVLVFNESGDGFQLPYSPTAPEELPARELQIIVEALTMLQETSFHGCERMGQIELFEEPPAGLRCPSEPSRIEGGCDGNILASGSLEDSSVVAAQRECELALIRGATCCSVQSGTRGTWFLTDGSPVAEGGVPAGPLREAWSCGP